MSRKQPTVASMTDLQLWRMADRFWVEVDARLGVYRPSEELRTAHSRLRAVMDELKLRGIQLSLGLREEQLEAADRPVDAPVSEPLDGLARVHDDA